VQVKISARHGHLSQSTQDRLTEKVEKLTRFFDRITGIEVTADLQNESTPNVEVKVTAERHDPFVASDSASSVSAALDSVMDKLEAQLRKHKEKVTEHRGPGHRHTEIDPPVDLPEPE
jgi:putative sigma-54 modulation protein